MKHQTQNISFTFIYIYVFIISMRSCCFLEFASPKHAFRCPCMVNVRFFILRPINFGLFRFSLPARRAKDQDRLTQVPGRSGLGAHSKLRVRCRRAGLQRRALTSTKKHFRKENAFLSANLLRQLPVGIRPRGRRAGPPLPRGPWRVGLQYEIKFKFDSALET